MLVTCAVQFCKENSNGGYEILGKQQYFYNFPKEFAVLGRIAKTRNTECQLGEPSEDYKQYCKNNNIEL